jgi:hypothetical protein
MKYLGGSNKQSTLNVWQLETNIARLEERLNSYEKAVSVATAAMDRRLDGMNEFREQLKDQASKFLTKDVYESKHELIVQQINDLNISKAVLEGKASQKSMFITMAVSIVSLLLALYKLAFG